MKSFFNFVRNIIVFRIFRPWVKYGKNVHCQFDVEIQSPSKYLIIGNNVGINRRCVIITDAEIGNDVLIAPHCALLNRGEHSYQLPGITIFDGPRASSEKIIIRDDVWIGFGSIILGGVVIGEGSVVAAGSLVVNDVEPYTIVAGSPAKEIKKRFNKDDEELHKKALKGRYDEKA